MKYDENIIEEDIPVEDENVCEPGHRIDMFRVMREKKDIKFSNQFVLDYMSYMFDLTEHTARYILCQALKDGEILAKVFEFTSKLLDLPIKNFVLRESEYFKKSKKVRGKENGETETK